MSGYSQRRSSAKPLAAVAVDRGRGGVDEGDAPRLRLLKQHGAEAEVVLHQVAPVGLHGVGAGALVEDGLDALVEQARQPRLELALVAVVGEVQAVEVAVLLAAGEVVDHQDVAHAEAVERAQQVAADDPAPPVRMIIDAPLAAES